MSSRDFYSIRRVLIRNRLSKSHALYPDFAASLSFWKTGLFISRGYLQSRDNSVSWRLLETQPMENLVISSFITCTLMFASAASTTPATDAQTTKPAVAALAKSQPQNETVNRPVSQPAKPASTAPAATTAKFEILAVEQSIVDRTNAERARYGLPALVIDPNLMASARRHGNWMASYRQMVHSNMGVAENIAMGQSSPQDVLRTWMNSSGHRANILGGYRRIGVSAYRSAEGTIFWCQQFMP